MPSKFLIGSMITFILACILFIVTEPFLTAKMQKKQEETKVEGKIYSIKAIAKTNCRKQKTFYTNLGDKRLYLFCLEDVEVNRKESITSLKQEKTMQEIMDTYEKKVKTENGMTFYEGKTGLSNVSMILCENGDIILGNQTLQAEEDFCKRTCTFTRSYQVIRVNEEKENYLLTLAGKENTVVNARVPKKLNLKYQINASYAFTFEKDELDSIPSATDQIIFDTFSIVAIKKTDTPVQEAMCKIG